MKNSKPDKLVLIGSSTGGPSHLRRILQALPSPYYPPIVIAQHMASAYIDTFASRLHLETHLDVKVAYDCEQLQPSTVYVTSDLSRIILKDGSLQFKVEPNTLETYNPDINQLFTSCHIFADTIEILAVILTGIGDDGAQGLKSLCDRNVRCIAESPESAVVYGMPMRAKEVSPDVQVKSLEQIINTISEFGAE